MVSFSLTPCSSITTKIIALFVLSWFDINVCDHGQWSGHLQSLAWGFRPEHKNFD